MQFYVILQSAIEKSNLCRMLFIIQMIQRSRWCRNRIRTRLVDREPITTLQIRHKALSAAPISIHHSHHSPLRDSRSVSCKGHHRPFHRPISRCLLLDLHPTATLISLDIPISNQDKGQATLALHRYRSLKSVHAVGQDAW